MGTCKMEFFGWKEKWKKEEVRLLNAYLDTLQAKIYEIHRQLISDGKVITTEIIKEKLMGVADKSKMILEVLRKHNEQLHGLVGSEYALGTVVL